MSKSSATGTGIMVFLTIIVMVIVYFMYSGIRTPEINEKSINKNDIYLNILNDFRNSNYTSSYFEENKDSLTSSQIIFLELFYSAYDTFNNFDPKTNSFIEVFDSFFRDNSIEPEYFLTSAKGMTEGLKTKDIDTDLISAPAYYIAKVLYSNLTIDKQVLNGKIVLDDIYKTYFISFYETFNSFNVSKKVLSVALIDLEIKYLQSIEKKALLGLGKYQWNEILLIELISEIKSIKNQHENFLGEKGSYQEYISWLDALEKVCDKEEMLWNLDGYDSAARFEYAKQKVIKNLI